MGVGCGGAWRQIWGVKGERWRCRLGFGVGIWGFEVGMLRSLGGDFGVRIWRFWGRDLGIWGWILVLDLEIWGWILIRYLGIWGQDLGIWGWDIGVGF